LTEQDLADDSRALMLQGPERGRAIAWLTVAFWLSNLLLLNLGTLLSGNPHTAAIMAMRALATLFGLLLCYLIHRLLNLPSLSSWRRRVIALALIAPIAAETFAWVNFFAIMFADPSVRLSDFTWTGAISTISFFTWFFLAWAGVYLALLYSYDVQDERYRSSELQAQAHEAQLRALHSQINPHFLFNSLNSVSALILDGKGAEADAMVSKLSQFLRMGLAVDPSEKIPLSREIALQRAYLNIERLRYPDLEVTIAVPAELRRVWVPSLILQPIVENAVKHGVAITPPPVGITIAATELEGRLSIEVRNDSMGSSRSSKGAGIGLNHVGQRLRLLYGDQGVLSHGPIPAGGYKVQITMPLELA
jgi:two-component system LytT family sensor kinase